MEVSLRQWLSSASDIISNSNSSIDGNDSNDGNDGVESSNDSDKLLIVGRYLFSLPSSCNLNDVYTSISLYYSNTNGVDLMQLLSSSLVICIEACLIYAVSSDNPNRYHHHHHHHHHRNHHHYYCYY